MAEIVVSGLKDEEKFFKESITSELDKLAKKIGREVALEKIAVHVNSHGNPEKRDHKNFELKAEVALENTANKMHCRAQGHELNAVLRDLLDKISEQARKNRDMRKSGGLKKRAIVVEKPE